VYNISKININQFQKVNINYFLLVLLFLISTCLHELGHIAACVKNNIKNGHIGWGVYFLFPVFYSDISNVWAASKNVRIITNLGGIFIEMIFSTLIFIIYILFYKNETLLLCYYSILIRVFWQLYPFVRSDGYWILSDLLSIPNLLPKANKAAAFILQPMRVKQYIVNSTASYDPSLFRRVFIISYGLINIGVTILFMYSILHTYHKEILLFPKTIFFLFYDLFRLKLPNSYLLGQYLLVAIWYYVAIIFILRFYRKWFSK
jgi:putative peptide zinc metalloprotease protein